MALTKKQKQTYDFVIKYKEEHDGNSPTYPEIAEAVGYSVMGAKGAVERLVKEGLMSVKDRKRCIEGGEWVAPGKTS